MGTRQRYDGTLLKDISAFRKINPFVMRGRNESAIYYTQLIEIEETHRFLKEYNRHRDREQRISLFHVILAAMVRVIALRPQLNRFISGQRIYQRNRIQIAFIVKKDLSDDGDETNAKITFSPFDTLEHIRDRANVRVDEARSMDGNESDREIEFITRLPRGVINLIVAGWRLLDQYGIAPRSMIEMDPLYTSVYVANLGSVGLDAPFHHLYEWGNASIFVVIGRPKRHLLPVGNGHFESRLAIELKYTLDDRVTEGYYAARALSLFRDFIREPQVLLDPPDLSPELLDELALTAAPEAEPE